MLGVHTPQQFVDLQARDRKRVDIPAAPRAFQLTTEIVVPEEVVQEMPAEEPEMPEHPDPAPTPLAAAEPPISVVDVSLTQTLRSGRSETLYAHIEYGMPLGPGDLDTLKRLMAHLHWVVVRVERDTWPCSVTGGFAALPALVREHYAKSALHQLVVAAGTGMLILEKPSSADEPQRLSVEDARDLLAPFAAAEHLVSLSLPAAGEPLAVTREVGAKAFAAINGRNTKLVEDLHLLAIAPPAKFTSSLLDANVRASTVNRIVERIRLFGAVDGYAFSQLNNLGFHFGKGEYEATTTMMYQTFPEAVVVGILNDVREMNGKVVRLADLSDADFADRAQRRDTRLGVRDGDLDLLDTVVNERFAEAIKLVPHIYSPLNLNNPWSLIEGADDQLAVSSDGELSPASVISTATFSGVTHVTATMPTMLSFKGHCTDREVFALSLQEVLVRESEMGEASVADLMASYNLWADDREKRGIYAGVVGASSFMGDWNKTVVVREVVVTADTNLRKLYDVLTSGVSGIPPFMARLRRSHHVVDGAPASIALQHQIVNDLIWLEVGGWHTEKEMILKLMEVFHEPHLSVISRLFRSESAQVYWEKPNDTNQYKREVVEVLLARGVDIVRRTKAFMVLHGVITEQDEVTPEDCMAYEMLMCELSPLCHMDTLAFRWMEAIVVMGMAERIGDRPAFDSAVRILEPLLGMAHAIKYVQILAEESIKSQSGSWVEERLRNTVRFVKQGKNGSFVWVDRTLEVMQGHSRLWLEKTWYEGKETFLHQVMVNLPDLILTRSRAGIASCSSTGVPKTVVPKQVRLTDVFVRSVNFFAHSGMYALGGNSEGMRRIYPNPKDYNNSRFVQWSSPVNLRGVALTPEAMTVWEVGCARMRQYHLHLGVQSTFPALPVKLEQVASGVGDSGAGMETGAGGTSGAGRGGRGSKRPAAKGAAAVASSASVRMTGAGASGASGTEAVGSEPQSELPPNFFRTVQLMRKTTAVEDFKLEQRKVLCTDPDALLVYYKTQGQLREEISRWKRGDYRQIDEVTKKTKQPLPHSESREIARVLSVIRTHEYALCSAEDRGLLPLGPRVDAVVVAPGQPSQFLHSHSRRLQQNRVVVAYRELSRKQSAGASASASAPVREPPVRPILERLSSVKSDASARDADVPLEEPLSP
jgi:hypothetical protein